ncbi:MAG: NUDIX hydrolase [Rhodospirillaceae bacterium]
MTERGPRVRRVPPGDDRVRLVCPECHYVVYQNPLIVVGSVPVWQERILLCRRAIEPCRGLWTLPAGFMEENETTLEGAAREAHEEAGARIEVGDLLGLYQLPRISQVHMFYRARLLSPEIAAGPESLEVALFEWAEIPWPELAFPTVRWALADFDARRGQSNFAPAGNPPNHPPGSEPVWSAGTPFPVPTPD